MEDFKIVIDKVMELFAIQIPIFGYNISILTIVIGMAILSIVAWAIGRIFGGD